MLVLLLLIDLEACSHLKHLSPATIERTRVTFAFHAKAVRTDLDVSECSSKSVLACEGKCETEVARYESRIRLGRKDAGSGRVVHARALASGSVMNERTAEDISPFQAV